MSEEIENYYGIPPEAQKPFKFANKIPTKEDLNKIVCKQVVEIVSLQQKVEQLEKEKDYLDDYNRHLHNENKQLENIRKEAIEYCKNKKEKIVNTTDYRQYYIQGYETAIKNTNSTHDGIALEWVKNAIKNDCDALLNILNKGSESNELQ